MKEMSTTGGNDSLWLNGVGQTPSQACGPLALGMLLATRVTSSTKYLLLCGGFSKNLFHVVYVLLCLPKTPTRSPPKESRESRLHTSGLFLLGRKSKQDCPRTARTAPTWFHNRFLPASPLPAGLRFRALPPQAPGLPPRAPGGLRPPRPARGPREEARKHPKSTRFTRGARRRRC